MQRAFSLIPICFGLASAQTSENVLVVVNKNSSLSRRIGDYYVHVRSVPLANLCKLDVVADEAIDRDYYRQKVEAPLAAFIKKHPERERILYIVTTLGIPLKIMGAGEGLASEASSVDSELTLLYGKLKGIQNPTAGAVDNPFFGHREQTFEHRLYGIYLVTRLAGYDFEDIKGLIDRSLVAADRGKFVLDLKSSDNQEGNDWLRAAASLLPKDRVLLEESNTVVYGERDVIGYAGWGSNDPNRKRRQLGFQWLPGAIVTEFVSTDGRTFQKPPDSWNIGTWKDSANWFVGSPQTLTADYIHEGATGCSGHVYEPFLRATPRPDYLLPAYFGGRNLAESYYLSMPSLSWQNIVIGDPLCRIGKAR